MCCRRSIGWSAIIDNYRVFDSANTAQTTSDGVEEKCAEKNSTPWTQQTQSTTKNIIKPVRQFDFMCVDCYCTTSLNNKSAEKKTQSFQKHSLHLYRIIGISYYRKLKITNNRNRFRYFDIFVQFELNPNHILVEELSRAYRDCSFGQPLSVWLDQMKIKKQEIKERGN